jgi:hypothetical protein
MREQEFLTLPNDSRPGHGRMLKPRSTREIGESCENTGIAGLVARAASRKGGTKT